MEEAEMKPRVGLLLGDPTGIGPELVAKLLAGFPVHEHADLVVIGDRRYFEMGQRIAGPSLAARVAGRFERRGCVTLFPCTVIAVSSRKV